MSNRTACVPGPRHRRLRRGLPWRPGLVLVALAVTSTVGIGSWVLGSGADAAPRRPELTVRQEPVRPAQPPLSVAPPPKAQTEGAQSERAQSERVAKRSAGSRAGDPTPRARASAGRGAG